VARAEHLGEAEMAERRPDQHCAEDLVHSNIGVRR